MSLKQRPTFLYENLQFPKGECQCGCREKTEIAARTDSRKGWVKDWPKLYLPNHQRRKWELNSETGCWIWKNYINKDGYGKLEENSEKSLAHRIYFQSWNGEIPGDKLLNNMCGNRSCVFPPHWELRYLAIDRTCARCQKRKSIDNFSLRVAKRGFFYAYCDSCKKYLNKEWAKNNPEKIKNSKQKWRSIPENAAKHRAIGRKRYKEDIEFRNCRNKYQKEWRRNNPEKVLAYIHARRARLRNAETDYSTKKDVWTQSKGICYICNKYWKYEEHGRNGWHIEHIQPLSKGGTDLLNNKSVACAGCNLSKSRRTLEEWKQEYNVC